MAIVRILIVGAGRAGTSFAGALRGHHEVSLVHHDEPLDALAVDLVLLCVRDDAIAATSRRVANTAGAVVAHVAGSRGLEVLDGHARTGSLHPLVTMPDGSTGAKRLHGAVFALEGDELLADLVSTLSGRAIRVDPARRALYHATAAVAANHLVALMGHVESLAAATGVHLDDVIALARQALEDVARVGPARALTGPASRDDATTIDAHLAALPVAERPLYVALAERARRLAREGATSCAG